MEEKKRRGDRRDARLVRDLTAMQTLMPHLFNKRTESEIYSLQDYDITKLLKFIEDENKEHPEYKTTLFHCIIAAFSRVIYNRPRLNRFIAARKVYQRDKVTFSFIAKRQFTDRAEEAMINLHVKPEMNLRDISREIVGDVSEAREGGQSSTEDAMEFLKKLPTPILSLVMGTLKFLAEHDWIPMSLIQGDLAFSTVLLTNLGSIKTSAVYHHLNEWGTNSVLGAIGTIHKKPVYADDGSVEIRDVVDIGVTMDERIGEGFYFAKSLKILQWVFDNPEELLNPVSKEAPEVQ